MCLLYFYMAEYIHQMHADQLLYSILTQYIKCFFCNIINFQTILQFYIGV